MLQRNLKFIKEIEKNLNDVNVKEVDEDRYEYYLNIKDKFENVLDSYKENLQTSNKIADFIELRTIMVMVSISMLVTFFVIRKRFNIV